MNNRDRKDLVFQIGFDRCGTTSLSELFSRNGYEAVHYIGKYGFVYGKLIEAVRHGEDPIARFPNSVKFFSDMKVPRISLTIKDDRRPDYYCFSKDFAILERWYPNAKFILNVRPVENWIVSTLEGERDPIKFMQAANEIGALFNVTGEALLKHKKMEFEDHVARVVSYFQAAQSNKLIVFDIENDPIDKLVEFMKPEFDLDPQHWGKHNASEVS